MTDRESGNLESRLKLEHLGQAAAIGLAAGAAALLFEHGVAAFGAVRVALAALAPPVVVLPSLGLVGGFLSGLIVQYIAPSISGSGIPQVKAAVAGLEMPLTIKVAIAKLIAGVLALGSGLFMGREGPTVHIGAMMGAQLGKRTPHGKFLAASGAAAGLAAAFNAPLAGVLFVIEELFRTLSVNAITTAAFACFVAAVVTNLVDVPHLRAMPFLEHLSITPGDLVLWPMLGIAGGILGAAFNWLVMTSLKLNRASRLPVSASMAVAGLLSGLIVAALPPAAVDYAHLRELVIVGQVEVESMPLFLVAFLLLTAIAYGSGAPGGLFAPALTIGSFGGALIAALHTTLGGGPSIESYTVLGMGAAFAGVARVPLTAIVIICEMTSHFELMLPLMISCIIATMVGERIYPGSIYDRLVDWAGYGTDEPTTAATAGNALQSHELLTQEPQSPELTDQGT